MWTWLKWLNHQTQIHVHDNIRFSGEPSAQFVAGRPSHTQTHPTKESSPNWLPPSTIAWDSDVKGSFFCCVSVCRDKERHEWDPMETQRAPHKETPIFMQQLQRWMMEKVFPSSKMLSQKREKRKLNGLQGGKLRWDVGSYFHSWHICAKHLRVFHILCNFFFPRRVPTAQSVMRHEPRQQMCEEEMEQQWCQEPEKWEEVLCVFTWPFPV